MTDELVERYKQWVKSRFKQMANWHPLNIFITILVVIFGSVVFWGTALLTMGVLALFDFIKAKLKSTDNKR